MKTAAIGQYARVNGLDMYYEIHGSGMPLVLLHGGLSTLDTDWGRVLPALATRRRVIGVEQQAHGHTADVDRPLRYEQLADDTAALLRELRIENADFVGYSMGGGIALEIARSRPALVRRVVFAGGPAFSPEGLHPGLLAGMAQMKPEHLAGTPFEKAYAEVAPHPEDWPRLIERMKELDLGWRGWRPEDVQSIGAPVLLIAGDSDIVRPEHVVEFFRLLGGGVAGDLTGLPRAQLAILPGTTHITLMERTDWLASMITRFLDAPMS